MKIRRGDIVAFDFPFNDATGIKVRPALVVSSDLVNERTKNAILEAISRSIHNATERHILIDHTTPAGRKTGLRESSVVQCDKLLTVDKKFILGTIGKLPASLLSEVDNALRASLEL